MLLFSLFFLLKLLFLIWIINSAIHRKTRVPAHTDFATPFLGFNLKHRWHWRQQFLLFNKTRFDFQTSTSCKFLFRSVQWTKVLTVNSCFQCFLQALSGNNLFLQQTQFTSVNLNFLKRFFQETPRQIFLCHGTGFKYYNCFCSVHHDTIVLWFTPSFRNFALIVSKVEMLAWGHLGQKLTFEKHALTVSYTMD